MKTALSLCLLFFSALSCLAEDAPFTLTVTPSSSNENGMSIGMGDKNSREFQVVLTNISKVPQPVWETWNSWGYQTVSFEITTFKGGVHTVSVRPQGFTKNFPSVFVIAPGESQVYPITLNKKWEAKPAFVKVDERVVSLKAIYKVFKDDEAPKFHVWTGQVESKAYQFILAHK